MITRQLSEMSRLLQLNAEEDWEAARQIAETACCLFSADYAAVLNPEKTSVQELKPLAEAGATMTEPRRLWLANLIPQILKFDQVVMIKDLVAHPEDSDRFTKVENLAGYATLILRSASSQTPLAVLYLECKNSGKCNFDQHKLLSFAEQAQTLLQSARLTSLSEKLSEIRETVVKSGETVKAMIDWFRDIAHADLVTIFPFYEDLQRFDDRPQLSGNRVEENFYRPSFFRPDDMAALAIRYRKPKFASDSKTLYKQLGGDGPRLGYFEQREQVLSSSMIPLLVRDELYGVLFFNFRHPQLFDENQQELLLNLSDFAAQALKQTRERSGRVERHAKELRLLEEIDQKIKGNLELEELLDEILNLAQSHIKKAEDATAMIYDSKAKELYAKASQGPNREKHMGSRISLRDDDAERGIQRWACLNRSPARVGNVKSEEWVGRYKQVVESTVSELDIPLFDGKQLIGTLSFESSKPEAFSVDDLNFLVTLSNRAVHVINKARSKEREQAINEILKAGLEILGAESSKQVLEKILDQALEITDSDQGAVLLHDQRWDDLYVVVERGGKDEERHRHVKRRKGIVGQVLESKKSLIANINDKKWHNIYIDFFEYEAGWQLTVPILKDLNEVRGIIVIERPTDEPFTEEELDLVERMAVLAEIALRNAEHYEMRQRFGVLQKVDQGIIGQLADPEEVLWTILESSLLLTKAEYADLHLYQNSKPSTTYFAEKKNGKPIRHRKLEGIQSEEIARGIINYAATQKVAYRTSEDAELDPNYVTERTDSPREVHCEIAVPLLNGSELVGILNLESKEYDDLTETDVELMQLLAGQAVIAYQNALRYRQEREATKRFQTLRDVGQRLSEITDLDEIDQAYKIVGEQLMAFQPSWVTIRRYDEAQQELIRKLHYIPTGKGTDLPPHKIGKGLGGYVAQRWLSGVDRSGKAKVISDVTNPPNEIKPRPASDKVRALVSAPVFFKDKYYGSLSLSHETVDFFKDKDIELIEGLAGQLGITIHRLEVAWAKHEADQKVRDAEILSSWGQISSSLAHSLGNSLGHIEARIGIIRRNLGDKLSSTIEEQLAVISQSVSKTLELNKQFRKFADETKETRDTSIYRERVNLREFIEQVLSRPELVPQNIARSFDWQEGLAQINIILPQITVVLINLVENAIEAMPEGGKLIFSARNLESHVELRITDTGNGISEQDQAKIFDLFYTTKESSGLGLGNAKSYAVSNGGDLTVESRPGEGATFILTLPRA